MFGDVHVVYGRVRHSAFKMSADPEQSSCVIFRPPVYQQRYGAVLELSRKLQPKKVSYK